MKKCLLFLLGVLLISCAKDENRGEKNGSDYLLAQVEDLQTVDGCYKLSWGANDKIGVYGAASINLPFSYQDEQTDMAVFRGALGSSEEIIDFAYYPYQASVERSGNKLSIVLPSEYEYTGGCNLPMIGFETKEREFLFKNLCGALYISTDGFSDDVDRFEIVSVGDDSPAIAGNAVVDDVSTHNAILSIAGNGTKRIVYHIQSEYWKNHESDGLVVPLPVGTYPTIKISLYGASDAEPIITHTMSDVHIARSTMQKVPIANPADADYVLSSNTQLLSDDIMSKVSFSTTDGSELFFDKGVSESDIPQVGSIILAKSSDNLPTGFLGRVTEINMNDDGSFVVKTEKVALGEAFDKLYINETVDLVPEGTNILATKGLLNSIFYDGELSHTFNWNRQIAETGILSEGYLSTGFRLTVNINLDKDKKLEYAAFTVVSNVKLYANINLFFSTSEEVELFEHKLGKIEFIPVKFWGGLVTINPTFEPYFYVTGEGYIENNVLEVEVEAQSTSAALYEGGKWEAKNRSVIKTNNESPWNFKNNIELDGTLRVGIAGEINYKLYNFDGMRVYITPEVGAKVHGNSVLNDTDLTSMSLEKFLTNTKLDASLYLRGKIGADASLLIPVDTFLIGIPIENEFEFEEYEFCKKEIKLIPSFKDLLVDVNRKEESTDSYEATINTELNGELLCKDVKVELELVNQEGDTVSSSEPISYNGGKTDLDSPDVVTKMDEKFENLDAETTYKVYPKITSPAFADLKENGTIELKSKAVEFKTNNLLRDVLIKIYNENNGRNWRYQRNWCSEAPVAEWEGVDRLDDGTYKFSFMSNNELTGTLSIENCCESVILCSSHTIESLNIKNCPNLKFDTPINTFVNLRNVKLDNIKLEDQEFIGVEGMSDSLKNYTFKFEGMSKLENIDIKNCQGQLYYMSVVLCPLLTSLNCDNLIFNEQKFGGLAFTDPDHRIEWGEYTLLNIDNCERLDSIQVNQCENIGSIYIQNCSSLGEVSFMQNCFRDLNVARKCDIQNFTVNSDYPTEGYMRVNFIDVENHSTIENVNIQGVPLTIFDSENIKISVLNSALLPGPMNMTYKFNDYLKCFISERLFQGNLDFNGCTRLETIICNSEGIVDVRNTPALQKFVCSGFTKDILLDAHISSVFFDCSNSMISKIIPDYLNTESGLFRYVPRFNYVRDPNTDEIEVVDRGYGWWYPGEPERGYH